MSSGRHPHAAQPDDDARSPYTGRRASEPAPEHSVQAPILKGARTSPFPPPPPDHDPLDADAQPTMPMSARRIVSRIRDIHPEARTLKMPTVAPAPRPVEAPPAPRPSMGPPSVSTLPMPAAMSIPPPVTVATPEPAPAPVPAPVSVPVPAPASVPVPTPLSVPVAAPLSVPAHVSMPVSVPASVPVPAIATPPPPSPSRVDAILDQGPTPLEPLRPRVRRTDLAVTRLLPTVQARARSIHPAVLVFMGVIACGLAASAAYVLQRGRAPEAVSPTPEDGFWRAPTAPQQLALDGATRAWAQQIVSRQSADGSFSASAGAPTSGLDTAQQFTALLASHGLGVIMPPDLQLRTLAALDHARMQTGWAGPALTLQTRRPSATATAWAALASAYLARHSHDENARQRVRIARDVLVRAQLADGTFPEDLGGGVTEGSPAATVMAAWALIESEAIDPASRATTAPARERALGWLRHNLSDPVLGGVPGLSEQALWVVWRSRKALQDRRADDTMIATRLARVMLTRCSPSLDPHAGCARPTTDATTPWIPWTALATAAMLQDPQDLFDVTTRASLSALMDWTLGRFEAERVEIMAGDSSSLAVWLFASSELQR